MSLLGCQPVSSYSHLLAAGVALTAAPALVRLGRGERGRAWALTVYACCVVVALTISGIYHSIDRGCHARLVMQRLDHYAIWLLIAGTFTAVHGIMWRSGFWRTGMLALVWSYAAIGIGLQVGWFAIFSGTWGLVLYLGLGWIGVASIVKLGRQLGFARVLPLLYSGIFFSAGAILEAFKWPILVPKWIEAHELFHFAVVAGVALNWLFIRDLVLNHAPRQSMTSDLQLAGHLASPSHASP